VLLSSGASSAIDPAGRRISNAALAKLVRSHADQSADEIATHLRRVLDCHESPADDLTVLVLRRS
jgi:hypothetical protein